MKLKEIGLIRIDFMSPKDSDENRTMNIISDNIEIMIVNKTSGIIKNTF